jgi:urease accessory protein UreF
MIDETVNSVVLSMFAIVIAFVMRAGTAVTPAVMRQRVERREGESWAEYTLRASAEKREAGREAVRTGTASYRLLLVALWGLMVVLIATLVASPVHMNWPVFLGVFAVAYGLAALVYRRARTAT